MRERRQARAGGWRCNPSPPRPIKNFGFRFNEPLGLDGDPYMRRCVLTFFGYSIRLHVWNRSDDTRFKHNHAFDFVTLVLRGGYTDVQPDGLHDYLSIGAIRFRRASHTHFVGGPAPGTTTILLCSRKKQNWGFFVKGKMMRPLRFFSRYGHELNDSIVENK